MEKANLEPLQPNYVRNMAIYTEIHNREGEGGKDSMWGIPEAVKEVKAGCGEWKACGLKSSGRRRIEEKNFDKKIRIN